MINRKYFFALVFSMVVCCFSMSALTTDVFAQVESGSAKFKNPIAYGTVEAALNGVLGAIQAIVATLAVLMIVIGGVIYITSAGNSGQIELAKRAITAAMIGLALALAAPALLREIYDILGASGGPAVTRDLTGIITETLKFLLGVIGTLSILMLVIGGVIYITSAGSDRADTAKKTIQYAIIGLIISILSLVIVKTIAGIF